MTTRPTAQTVVSSSGGIGFVGALTIVFITLKLTGVIDWSWLWVLSPIWITVCVVLGILVSVVVVIAISDHMKEKRRKRLQEEHAARWKSRSLSYGEDLDKRYE